MPKDMFAKPNSFYSSSIIDEYKGNIHDDLKIPV